MAQMATAWPTIVVGGQAMGARAFRGAMRKDINVRRFNAIGLAPGHHTCLIVP
jgi:hypothetical protein